MAKPGDEYRAKFRPPVEEKLDREIEEALEGVSLDALYGLDKPDDDASTQTIRKGVHKGRVLSIDLKDDACSSISAARARAIASLSQFEEPPKVGEEMEFHVERYDRARGC